MGLLHKFEGRDVIGTRIAVANAGDGLSQALAIDPEELTHGETVYLVIEAVVDKVTHERVKDTESLIRVHRLKAGAATMVEKSLVIEAIDAQKAKIEEAQGISRLNFDDGDEAKDGGNDDGND